MKSMNVCHETIRVLIVDDQRLIRKTLEAYLDTQINIEVLDCVACGVDALEQIDKLNPDIAIVDLEMPGMSGVTTIEIISERFPDTKTIVLSSHGKKDYINQAITAGARGYLMKGATPEEITETIHKVNLGHFQLGSKVLEEDGFGHKVKFNQQAKTTEVLESEENIPFIPTKVEVVNENRNNRQEQSDTETESHRKFRSEVLKIRRDLLEILEFKLNLAAKQKQEMQVQYKKLQTKFSWLFASQIVSFLIMIGCLSSLIQIQFKVTDLQGETSQLDSVQLVK